MPTELIKRGAFTLGALLVCLLGIYIPLPGVDAAAWKILFDAQRGMLGQANALSGGAVSRLGIFSLSIMPYVSAAIVVQLLAMVSPALARRRDDGERGRATIELYTRCGTVLLAALQGYGVATGLESAAAVVPEPGLLFRLTTMLTLTAGTLFLVWLAGQITARGLGNGVALILTAGIVNVAPREIATLLEGSRLGIVAPRTLLWLALGAAAFTALVVMVERARRRLPVEFAERRIGTQTTPRRTADIALKLNPAGLMPAFIVGVTFSIVSVVLSLAALLTDISGWRDPLNVMFSAPVRLPGTAILMVLFTLVYTAFVCDPDQMAARLAACGGTLPGIAPGEATAAYLDRALSRAAAIGATYLVAVTALPELVTLYLGLPVMLSGTSLLVLVCVALDLISEVEAYSAQAT
jgi:preprotein translocase subunit SecY